MSITVTFNNLGIPNAEFQLLEYITDEVTNDLNKDFPTLSDVPVAVGFGSFAINGDYNNPGAIRGTQ